MVLPRFLTELKRRNVYRAALVYAGVGWVLLEVADVAFPRLGLPDWTVNFVLALVLLGFPLAIVFAWIFDFSAQGVVRTQSISPEVQHRFSISSIAEFVLIGVLVVTVGYLYVDRLSLRKRLVVSESADSGKFAIPNPENYRAIAVLPFADMSEAGDQDWFAEGISEELLIALSQVDELKVMARTSSFAFKDTDKTIADIAEILGVQAVLEGSVRRSGERVRITAQLIDSSHGFHIWSGSYERKLTDIFELQDELARGIVETLRVELGIDAAKRLVAEQTRSPEAYNWFMRGRALDDWSTQQSTFQSISYLEKAVEVDPEYARAWGYLAFARAMSLSWQPFSEASSGAITAYERALALDPEQSEALAVKALMTQILEHDWETAVKLYQRAMASRENARALGAYVFFFLQHIDEGERAIQLWGEVEKRDPLHAGYKAILSLMLLVNGNFEAAAQKARESLELNPQNNLALMTLIEAYTVAGNYAAAQQVLENIPSALQQWPNIRIRAGLYYLATGDHHKASEIYREYIDNPISFGTMTIAELALSLGEVEEAIDLMKHEVENNELAQYWSRTRFRHNDAVKDHPRYLALLKRIGLDDESVAELRGRMSFD
jgi:TolB-like protein/Tfp pilus assembly protein PilF